MSDMFPGPSGDPRYPQQPLLPHPAYGHDAPLGGFRLGRALGLLVILLLLLLVPNFVEEVRFAWTRGKERAEAEIARQVLDEGRGPTIGQYRTVVKAVQSSVVGVKATRAAGGRDLDDLALDFRTRRAPRAGSRLRRDHRSGGLYRHELPRCGASQGSPRRTE